MAPGHFRLILVREMIVFEHVQRRFLVFPSLYRRSAVEGLGRRQRQVTIPLQSRSAGGPTLPQGSQKDQFGNWLHLPTDDCQRITLPGHARSTRGKGSVM